jgi:hypothetical protein
MMNQDGYLTSIDRTDAFLRILIRQSSMLLFQFAGKDHFFQFRVIPFRMFLSPMIFTKFYAQYSNEYVAKEYK